MKKLSLLLTAVGAMLTLSSFTSAREGRRMSFYYESDSTKASHDTTISVYDTLQEVEVTTESNLRVVDVINKSLKNGLTQPRQKNVSDLIGSKATDYIMHPFAWKERRKEKRRKVVQQKVQALDAAKSYEEALTEAINRQLREDSIAGVTR